MLDRERFDFSTSVLVMNEKTLRDFLDIEYDYARKLEKPIKYILSLAKLDMIVDNSLPEGVIEQWASIEEYYDFIEEIEDDDFY